MWHVIAYFLSFLVGSCPRCCGAPELAESVAVPNSEWVVLTQVFRCSAMDGGALEIFAEDVKTKQHVTILYLNSEEDTHVEILGDDHIQISLPNLVHIKSQAFSVGPYEITYKYLPSNDPEARAIYTKWLEDPSDPVASSWVEENIWSKNQPGVPVAK